MPSMFTVDSGATDDEVWNKILETLEPEERREADRSVSEVNEPYEGAKEITVKTTNKTDIAIASISEIRSHQTDWSVYKEF